MPDKFKPNPDDGRIWVSHSQLDTYALCPRKWWFGKRCKLPAKKSRSTLKGSIAHECLERYLEGKDEIFPENWYIHKEGTLIAEEQSEVSTAVNKAIEEGLVERREGQLIEEHITYQLEGNIWMQGYIDLLDVGDRAPDWQITDHKTSSSTRYLETEKSLASNVQLARYGHAVEIIAREKYGVELGDIPVRHNQLVWGGPVRKRTAVISKATREKIHEDTIDLAVLLEETYSTHSTDPDDWQDIPGPEPGSNACQKYGGCSFQNICAHQCSVTEYVAMRNGTSTPMSDEDDWDALGASINPDPEPDMSEFDSPSAEKAKAPRRFKRLGNKSTTATTTPASTAPKEKAPAKETETVELTNQALVDAGVVDAERAPWGIETEGEEVCSDCDGYGYFLDNMEINGKKRKKGEQCPKCRLLSSMGKRKADINDYIVTADTQTGLLQWELKNAPEEVEPEPEVQASEEPEEQEPESESSEPSESSENSDDAAEEQEPETTARPKKGGRRKSTAVYYGITPVRMTGKYQTDVEITQMVIEAMGGSQFYSRPLYDQENDVRRYALDHAHDYAGAHYFLTPGCSAIAIWFAEGLVASGIVTQVTQGERVRPK